MSATEDTDILFEVITTPEAMAGLREEWDELFARCSDAGIVQSWGHAAAGWKSYGTQKNNRLYCLVGRRGGELVLVWPFRLIRRLIWNILSPIGPAVGEYSAILSKEGGRIAAVAASLVYLKECRPADFIKLPCVKANTALHSALVAQNAALIRECEYYTSDWSAADRTGDLPLKQNGMQRRKWANVRRHLAKRGALDFEIIEDREQFSFLIDWVLKHKKVWAKDDKAGAWWLWSDAYCMYLKELFVHARAPIRPLGFTLRSNGVLIAVKLGMCCNRTIDLIIATYDDDWEKYSPGTRLDEYWVDWAFRQGLEMDLGIGAGEYKRAFTNGHEGSTSTMALALTWWGWILWLNGARGRCAEFYWRLRNPMKRENRSALDQAQK